MNRDQIIDDFFRSLRIALTNAFSYSKDHPYFIKSVGNFKLELEEILVVLNPLKIGVTNLGLVVDGKNLTRIGFYDELARLLHQRKIKSIEIRRGASLQELVQFLSLISLPQKYIFKNGGLSVLLENERLIHFTIEELDYSAFLQGAGQECADIWGFMLKDAVQSNDAVKLGQLADGFGSFINQVSEKDLFDAEGISSEVNEFLDCLRGKNKEKFDKCSQDVFLWLLRNKKSLTQEDLIKLKPVFNALSQEDFSALLEEGFTQEEDFDTLSLQVFSKISEQKNSPKITENFFNKMNATQGLMDNPQTAKKIRSLLSTSQDDPLSAVYRNTLESLIKGISFSGKLIFDHKLLKENYRYIVLSVLATDENTDILQMAAVILGKELAGVFEDNDVGLLKDLCGVLAKRKQESIKACIDLEKSFSSSIENIALNNSLTYEQEFLLEMVSWPSQDLSLYLEKIFTAEKVNKQALNLFLRLFRDNLEVFYESMNNKIQDTEFLGSLTDALSQIDTPATLSVLEYIYSSSNELIKLESLKAMHKLKKVDTAFLIFQLKTDSLLLRNGLFSVLILDVQARKNALDLLFKITSFLGNKNKLLIENMKIAFDLRFVEAISCIKDLSHRRFFWNKQLRNKAIQILKEWNAR
ncbi:MAG: hypothetical protein ACYDFR_05195 [Candidatus Omnitrophota bacterium]